MVGLCFRVSFFVVFFAAATSVGRTAVTIGMIFVLLSIALVAQVFFDLYHACSWMVVLFIIGTFHVFARSFLKRKIGTDGDIVLSCECLGVRCCASARDFVRHDTAGWYGLLLSSLVFDFLCLIPREERGGLRVAPLVYHPKPTDRPDDDVIRRNFERRLFVRKSTWKTRAHTRAGGAHNHAHGGRAAWLEEYLSRDLTGLN